jgi:hypothetical protein
MQRMRRMRRMRHRVGDALLVALGLGLSLVILGAAGEAEKTRYEVELGVAPGKVPIAVRLDKNSGQLCSFVFDQVQQSLVARGCYPHVDRGL